MFRCGALEKLHGEPDGSGVEAGAFDGRLTGGTGGPKSRLCHIGRLRPVKPVTWRIHAVTVFD